MSEDVKRKAASAGIWFASITIGTQIISWVFTFYVVRLLDPQDYGLMTMASFPTAYLQMFGGLGIGAAIVHSDNVPPRVYSSLFWFSLAVGSLLAVGSFALATPTAWLFHDDRLIPITRLISVLFIISAISTVPSSLLVRDFELRKVAVINLLAAVISSTLSVIMARRGWGVYTLIWTNIILNFLKSALTMASCRWSPSWHYDYQEVRPHLRYGLYVAFSNTFQRLFQSVDKLIIGKVFGAARLGIYDNAMTMANMPIDKLWPLYQQVVFPLFARLKSESEAVYEAYVKILRHYLLMISPIYLGALVAAPELISAVLGTKWLGLIPWFRAFCVAKLCESLVSYNSAFFNATSRHREVPTFHLLVLVLITAAILLTALHSFEAVLIPWLTLYPLLCLGWIVYGLKRYSLSLRRYLAGAWDGSKAAVAMAIVLIAVKLLLLEPRHLGPLTGLLLMVGIGASVFCAFLFLAQRPLVDEALKTLLSRRKADAASKAN